MKCDVAPTVEAIMNTAALIKHSSDQLMRVANDLSASGNINDASEAAEIIQNMLGNLGLQELMTRPLEAMRKQVWLDAKKLQD